MRDESEAGLDALMGRLAKGERSAFEPLFRALYPRALRFARAKLTADVAHDVAQAAMLRVFANAHRFKPGRPAMPWFYAIVANEIRSARRQTRRYDELEGQDAAHPEKYGSAEDEALTRELRRALYEAVDALDDNAAAAIRAQLEEAERPPVESSAFRKRVSRAYARLRVLLGEFR